MERVSPDYPKIYQDVFAYINFGRDIIERGRVKEPTPGAYKRALRDKKAIAATIKGAGWQSPAEMAEAIKAGVKLFGGDQFIQHVEDLAEFFPKEAKK